MRPPDRLGGRAARGPLPRLDGRSTGSPRPGRPFDLRLAGNELRGRGPVLAGRVPPLPRLCARPARTCASIGPAAAVKAVLERGLRRSGSERTNPHAAVTVPDWGQPVSPPLPCLEEAERRGPSRTWIRQDAPILQRRVVLAMTTRQAAARGCRLRHRAGQRLTYPSRVPI